MDRSILLKLFFDLFHPRCSTCHWCFDGFAFGLCCMHPDNRNPYGCLENDYCDRWMPKASDQVNSGPSD